MTPIPSATVVLLREHNGEIETLLMKRNSKANFLGGFWVFPGGAVESEDEVDGDIELTMRNAAARETAEEASLSINHDALFPFSRWITPEGVPKRFDTWFFIGKATEQDFTVDGCEITDGEWVTPQAAIQKHREGYIEILPPTYVSLLAASQFSSLDQLDTHYTDKDMLLYTPRICFHEEQLMMLYPGDAGFEASEATNTQARHRCIHTDAGWEYINEIGVVI